MRYSSDDAFPNLDTLAREEGFDNADEALMSAFKEPRGSSPGLTKQELKEKMRRICSTRILNRSNKEDFEAGLDALVALAISLPHQPEGSSDE